MQAHKVFTDSGVTCGGAAGIHTLSSGREVRSRKEKRVQPEASESPWGPVCSPFLQAGLWPTILTQGGGGHCRGRAPGDPGTLGPPVRGINHRKPSNAGEERPARQKENQGKMVATF